MCLCVCVSLCMYVCVWFDVDDFESTCWANFIINMYMNLYLFPHKLKIHILQMLLYYLFIKNVPMNRQTQSVGFSIQRKFSFSSSLYFLSVPLRQIFTHTIWFHAIVSHGTILLFHKLTFTHSFTMYICIHLHTNIDPDTQIYTSPFISITHYFSWFFDLSIWTKHWLHHFIHYFVAILCFLISRISIINVRFVPSECATIDSSIYYIS